jgi:hypothetical protein
MPRSRKRKRRNESEWTEILARFQFSGMTVREFCRRERISLSSFQRWRSRVGPASSPEFVELVPSATVAATDSSGWSLEIALPNGAQLRFRG